MKKNYLFTSLFLLLLVKAFAQPAGWSHVMPFTITENSGTLVTDYQARIDINTQALVSAGQMLASGDDIRFGKDCSGSTLYNYWIESGMNTASTVIWVKIDTLHPSATRSFYMYYGNAAASSLSAVPGTFVGPMSSTDSVASGAPGGVGNSQRGFRFSPNEDILVTAFGKNEPTGTPRYITLFNFSTQAVLMQNTVSGPAGQYSYANIPNPMWLTQGTQYLLEMYQDASDGYYFGTSSQVGQQLTYYDMRYCNSCTQNTFPTNTLTNYQYGYPDLWYWRKNNVSPAPTIVNGTYLSLNAGADHTICYGDSVSIGGNATGGGSESYIYNWQPATGLSASTVAIVNASPSVTTTYTVSVIDACGTVVYDSLKVTVNPLPVLNVTASVPVICGSGSSVLTVSGAQTYLWTPGAFTTSSITVSPVTSTTYYVRGTDANTCASTDSILLTVAPLPSVSVTGNYTVSCDNAVAPLTMNASGASTYNWMPISASGSSVTDTPVASTTYTVVGTDSNGCTDTANYSVTLLPSPSVMIMTTATDVCAGVCDTLTAMAGGGSAPYTYSWTPTLNTSPVLISCQSSTNCHTITLTDANGCMATASTCITVNPLPVITSSSLAVICAGDSASLTVTGTNIASTTWSPATGLNTTTGSSVMASPASSTTYSVVVASSAGCTDSTGIPVTVNPLPTVTFVSALDTLCLNDGQVTLTGGSPAGGTYSGTGVSGNTFSPPLAGNGAHSITYSYTDANACSASATHSVVVDPCTGIAEAVNAGNVSVYPNPFSTVVSIERAATTEVTVNLFDAQGKLVLSKKANGTRIAIETAELANGIYSLQLLDEKGEKVIKLIKNN